jgi:hypothetical protein
MNFWIPPWLLIMLAPALVALGAAAHHVWQNQKERSRRRIPSHWPLTPRNIVNTEEARVWNWLTRAFYDHQIMIKLPVTRFTVPREMEKGMVWYRLLNGVYCTFTICTADGRVVGCVDVPGRNAIPRNTRLLKHSLLTQCELPYWVVRSSSLPTVTEIRAEFLGETPTAQTLRDREMEERALIAAQSNLRTALHRQRGSRQSDFSPLTNWPNSKTGDPSSNDFGSQWQDNSFLIPLDSRKGDLL